MQVFRNFIVLFSLFALGITASSAKTLTKKQARDAAARIDSLLTADLKTAKLKPTGRIDAGTFLRRAYLGIIGRIPTEKEARDFLDNPSSNQRADLVDSLTASPGFDSHLFNWAGDLLRVQTKQEQWTGVELEHHACYPREEEKMIEEKRGGGSRGKRRTGPRRRTEVTVLPVGATSL